MTSSRCPNGRSRLPTEHCHVVPVIEKLRDGVSTNESRAADDESTRHSVALGPTRSRRTPPRSFGVVSTPVDPVAGTRAGDPLESLPGNSPARIRAIPFCDRHATVLPMVVIRRRACPRHLRPSVLQPVTSPTSVPFVTGTETSVWFGVSIVRGAIVPPVSDAVVAIVSRSVPLEYGGLPLRRGPIRRGPA